MKYIWVFSLLFFTQLSWSAEENTQLTHDYLDIAAESVCKDHEKPEICKAEYKTALLLHQLGKTIGVHNFTADSSNTDNPLVIGIYDESAIKALCEYHENPETCRAEAIKGFFTTRTSTIMEYPPQMPDIVTSRNQFCETYYPEKIENCLSAFNSTENSLKELRDFIGPYYKQ